MISDEQLMYQTVIVNESPVYLTKFYLTTVTVYKYTQSSVLINHFKVHFFYKYKYFLV